MEQFAGKTAVVTGAGNLKARYIMHAVGPIYRGGSKGEAETLASCYKVCLKLAADRGLKSIAFPAISAGIYGYPLAEAAAIAVREIESFLKQPSSIEKVRMVLYGAEAFNAFKAALGNASGGAQTA